MRRPIGAGEAAVVALETPVTSNPPFVIDVFGEVAPDGEAIGLRIQRSAQGPVDLCLRIEDVQHLVSILLALSCEAKRLQPGPEFEGPPSGAIPLPLSAINVGQTDDDQTFLLLEVGAASLMFGAAAGDARRGRADAARPERAHHLQTVVAAPSSPSCEPAARHRACIRHRVLRGTLFSKPPMCATTVVSRWI